MFLLLDQTLEDVRIIINNTCNNLLHREKCKK